MPVKVHHLLAEHRIDVFMVCRKFIYFLVDTTTSFYSVRPT